jgi:hypothetical protein
VTSQPPPNDFGADDGPVDPNPSYAEPPWSTQYLPQPPAPTPPLLGYPGSYPPPWDSDRPGGVLAASVLAYIDAGLLILAGLVLLVGASAINDWNDAFGGGEQGFTAELTADGVINLVSAGLQIAGAVMMAGRNVSGRVLFSLGAGMCVGAGCYWLLRVGGAQAITWTGVFVALPIIGLVLCWTAQSTAWLRGENPRPGPPRAFGT